MTREGDPAEVPRCSCGHQQPPTSLSASPASPETGLGFRRSFVSVFRPTDGHRHAPAAQWLQALRRAAGGHERLPRPLPSPSSTRVAWFTRVCDRGVPTCCVRCFCFLLAFAAAAAARADEPQTQPTIQVTASRVAETVDETLADVSVITRADIDASGARDVLEILRLQAGVDVYRTGGPGQQTSLFLRGTNSNHVLVLIDGVRAASDNTGAFAFEWLPLDAVERIEIVRGPRASYWGSDAIGGVIQIFTRKLEGPRIALGYGTLSRRRRQRRHRSLERCRWLQRRGRRAPRRRFLGDESRNLQRPERSVLHVQPRRRRLSQHESRRARARMRSAASSYPLRCTGVRAKSHSIRAIPT